MLTTLLFLLVFGLLAFDSWGFPGKSLKYFSINSTFLVASYLIIYCLLALRNSYHHKRALILLNKFLLPFLTLPAFIFVVLNRVYFESFILNQFNIQTANFVLLAIFNGAIIYINYSKLLTGQLFRKFIYFVGPLTLLTMMFIDVFYRPLFFFLIHEDGIFETLQFIMFLMASGLALKTALNFRHRRQSFTAVGFFILTLGLFFIAGEEVAWGQRFFGITVPEVVLENNWQGELTVHNQGFFQSYIHMVYMAVGIYGAFSRLLLDKLIGVKKTLSLRLLTPPLIVFFYFFSTFVFYFLNQYLVFYFELFTNERVGMGKWQEVAELFTAFGFLIFTLSSIKESKLIKKI